MNQHPAATDQAPEINHITAHDEPAATDQPVATDHSIATDHPAAANEPSPTDQPEAPDQSAAAGQPAAPDQPAAEQSAPQPAPEDPRPETVAAPPANDPRRRAQEAWERLVQARTSGEVITGTVKSSVKGGLLIDMQGFRAFLPASQLRVDKDTALESLARTELPLKVIDVDETRKRLVVSHSRALDVQRRAERNELLRTLKVGDEREVTVARLTDFGAFVQLAAGVDALIPLRELALERIEKAADVVQPGERLRVRVIRVEENGKKIAVSRRALLPDPWRDHGDLLRQGTIVQGTVVAKEPRLEIEVAPGIVGSISDREADPAQYEIGESVEVSIRSADFKNRRLRLTTMHDVVASNSSGFAPLGEELGR
jgi:predicted RNA-binding protein with RPS1 domain